MSRRSQRNQSTNHKRKKSIDDDHQDRADSKLVPPAKVGEMTSKEQNITKEKIATELQENTSNKQETTAKDGLRPHFLVAQKRATEARRRLDSLVGQHQYAVGFKIYMTQIQRDLRKISNQLRICQKSNVRLEKEVKQLKSRLGSKKTIKRHPRKQLSVNKPVKTPRPQTLVVALPNNPDDSNQNLREVLVTNEKQESEEQKAALENEIISDTEKPSHMSDGNLTFIALNVEEDYPDGTWLGDEDNPQMRVRCPISPGDMMHVMSMYKSADKVALKLLDLLFDKETQATSNISGTGKHNKRKLDPLFIFGIYCHLVKHYAISAEDWHRIKQNVDSKCRTAFRRKLKGLALYPKQERKAKRSRVDMTSHFNQQCQHLQQVVNQLQTLPMGEGLAGITIIQEQPDGTTHQAVEPSAAGLVGHTILHQQGTEIHPEQLKEVLTQAGSANEIHLNGQTIAISQLGEMEIQEVDVVQTKEEEHSSRVLTFHPVENKKTDKDCALEC